MLLLSNLASHSEYLISSERQFTGHTAFKVKQSPCLQIKTLTIFNHEQQNKCALGCMTTCHAHLCSAADETLFYQVLKNNYSLIRCSQQHSDMLLS